LLKRYLYLISPPIIKRNFYQDLDDVLSIKNVKFFQLRLKKYSDRKIIEIAKKVIRITKKHKVKMILNDKVDLSLKVRADGCHLGKKDGNLKEAKKKLGKKILGATCHNSKILCVSASKSGAAYLALGSFFKSKLKPKTIRADLSTLKWASRNIKKPIVAIGGIDERNFKKLLDAGANYIALSTYIWNNPSLKPKEAIKKFNYEDSR